MIIPVVGFSLSVLLLVGGLGGCSRQELTIRDTWIPEAPSTVSALAAYMTIENSSGETRTLIGATGALFERVEIHQTIYERGSGLARMIRQDQVDIKPGESLLFEPGGYHLMLLKPKKALKEGEGVALKLVFADGLSPTVEFEVRRDRLRF